MTDDDAVPPFDDAADADLPEAFDDMIWDAVPVDIAAPAPQAVEAPAESNSEPVPVRESFTPPTGDEPPRPVSLHVEQSDVG